MEWAQWGNWLLLGLCVGWTIVPVAASLGTTDFPCHCYRHVSKGYSNGNLQVVCFLLSEAGDTIISDR